jgi:hypothetical protein
MKTKIYDNIIFCFLNQASNKANDVENNDVDILVYHMYNMIKTRKLAVI